MMIGYSRVTIEDESDFQEQVDHLNKLGVDPTRIHIDYGFSTATMSSSALEAALAQCRHGDSLVVPALDRLGDTDRLVECFRNARDRAITINAGGNLHTPEGLAIGLELLEQVSTASKRWNSHRTREAMAQPAVRSRLRGRRPKLSAEQQAAVVAQHESGTDPSAIATAFQIDRSTVYRTLRRAADAGLSDRETRGRQ